MRSTRPAAQIELILHPPTADVGAEYDGKVVNITKFGAFVNILPGRDGLVHISKLGGKRRIDQVEDVVEPRRRDPRSGSTTSIPTARCRSSRSASTAAKAMTPAIRARAARPTTEVAVATAPRVASVSERSERPAPKADDSDAESGDRAEYVSFEDAFDSEAKEEFGDLGPEAAKGDGGGRGRGRRRR